MELCLNCRQFGNYATAKQTRYPTSRYWRSDTLEFRTGVAADSLQLPTNWIADLEVVDGAAGFDPVSHRRLVLGDGNVLQVGLGGSGIDFSGAKAPLILLGFRHD